MKNLLRITGVTLIAALLLLPLSVSGCTKDESVTDDPIVDGADIQWEFFNERAESFVATLSSGDFSGAREMFDASLRRTFSEAALQNDFWNIVIESAGEFVSIQRIDNAVVDEHFVSFITSLHENNGVVMRILFSRDGSVSDVFIDGYKTLAGEITQRDGFTDYPVIIGEGTDFPLSGIMSVPDNAMEKVPAVVIVHSFGAHDTGATMATSKQYRDIAEHLASNGIAVIRYDKRTFTYGTRFDGSWTAREETIYDAVLATEMLKADPRIDESRVFIIGHGFGGMLAPRIHAEGGDYAGLILLAGSPRFMFDIGKDQRIAFINETMEGEERDEALALIEASWDAQIRNFLDIPAEVAKTAPTIHGISAYHTIDLYNNPMSAFIDEVTGPILALQGSDDKLVFAEVDFVLLQEMLASRSNVDFKLYEGLNHQFIPSAIGPSAGSSYDNAIEGQIDSQVLADIVGWIHRN